MATVVTTAGLYSSAATQSRHDAANIDRPSVLGPTAGGSAARPLPVESLRAAHGLDLSDAPSTPAPNTPRAKVEAPAPATGKAAQPVLQMPSLVAPQNATPRLAQAGPSEKPPTAPQVFKPQWRPSGKSHPDSESDAAEVAKAAPSPAPAVTSKPEPKPKAEASTPRPAEESVAQDQPTAAATKVAPVEPLKPLTRNQIYLRNKMRKVLSYYYRKPLNSRDHDAWEAMHGMLAYGLHSRIRNGGPRGESVTAIGWLCYNNPCKRKQLMRLNNEGEIRAQYGVGLQGHMGQFLAMLAQCNVDTSYPIRVDSKEFTIVDLIESEKETCYTNTELTFKLIGLMHYLPSDSTWVNDQGDAWSIERLIEEELQQPIRGAACGGTHRLGGLSLAVKRRAQRGEPVDGAFKKAEEFTKRYQQYAYRLQNSDGSFSTEWFRGPGAERDINRRCRTSGHLLEWLLYEADEDELTSYRVVKGVNYLTNLLYSNSSNQWEVGPLCHALHALTIYDQRMFAPYDEPEQTADAKADGPTDASASAQRQPSRTLGR